MSNEIVLTKEQIDEVITRIADELNAKFESQTHIPGFISVLKGAEPCFNELIKKCKFEMKMDISE